MSTDTQVIYQTRVGRIDMQLYEGDLPADLTLVTGMVAELRYRNGTIETFDSTTHPQVVGYLADGSAHVDLAAATAAGGGPLPNGEGQVRIITIDPSNPNGVVWDEIPVLLRD